MCKHLELPYHWQIMKPKLKCLLPEETLDPSSIQHHLNTDSVFSITPVMAILSPTQEHEFLLTYCPKDVCALTQKTKTKTLKKVINFNKININCY